MIIIFVLLALGGVPWLLALSKRFGLLVAVPGTAAAAILLALAVLLVTRAAQLDIVISQVVGGLLFAAAGVLVLWHTPGALRRPGRHAVALWVSPVLGALGWIGILVAAQFVPGAARLSWAMNGDGFNNLFYGNVILSARGLAIGQSENPVPLPASLLALAMAPGRATIADRHLLAHDLASFTLVWTLILAATCILTGAVVASAIPARYPRAVAVASALGSLLPLTWYVAGLPVQWGYFNANVVLPVLLATWLAFLASRRFPLVALVVLSGLTTLVLATWAPLVLVPGALGIVILVRDWKRIRSLQGPAALALGLGAAQVLSWVGIVTVPTFLAQGDALEIPGHGFPSAWPALPLLLIALVALALFVRRTTSLPVLPGIIAIVCSTIAATGMLLYLDRGQGDPWSAYYPTKLAWILSVFLAIVALSLAVSTVAAVASGRRFALAGIAAVTVAVLLACGAMPVDSWSETVIRQPMTRILSGSIWHTGDRAADQILTLSDPRASGILWQSGDPDEAMIDFWVLVTRGGDFVGDPELRSVAFVAYREYRATGTFDDSDIVPLCRIVTLMKPTPTVHTASPSLEAELRETCPMATPRVLLDSK
ncbi:hypothetical protein [Lacisediminihabitans sp.]|uniref:hypothetical protein n=1 Tax=Lacisediminihabitans sp. TaxID=2787631 RepID=UPI002F9381A7